MINLDGIDLILADPDGRVEKFIREEIPVESYRPWLRESWPGFGTAGIAYPTGRRDEPPIRLNRFRWPWGASRWAYGHFLASSDQVEQIYGDSCAGGAYNKVTFLFGTPETGEQVSTKVYVLPPTPLSGIRGLSQETTGTQSLYLLTLVDDRYFWWYQNIGDIEIKDDGQWSDLYDSIENILGIDLTFDTIDPDYLQPSTMFQLPYEPIPIIFDAIAYCVGQRVVRNYDGSVYSMNYQTALQKMQSDFASNPQRTLTAGGLRFSNPP